MEKREIIETLKKYDLRPKKYMGQNFLVNNKVFSEIIKAADLKKNDTVLEIGPGIGNLTKKIAKKVKRIIAVEKDKNFVRILNQELKINNIKNVKIIEGDILKLTTDNLQLKTNYKIVANLPYYIVSPTIRKFLEEKNPPELMVLMVQKEVARRICAKPPKMTLLSVAVQLYSKPKFIKIVKKECFWPKPKVDSTILKIQSINSRKYSLQFRDQFFKIVKAGFSSPRKQIKNNLASFAKVATKAEKKIFGEDAEKLLKKVNINPFFRPSAIPLGKWISLSKVIKLN